MFRFYFGYHPDSAKISFDNGKVTRVIVSMYGVSIGPRFFGALFASPEQSK